MLIFQNILFASADTMFLDLVKKTYSKYQYPALENLHSLSDYEQNTTQRDIKQEFEKVLPIYLESETDLNTLDGNLSSIYTPLKNYMQISALYINLISEKGNKKSLQILEKNLQQLNNPNPDIK